MKLVKILVAALLIAGLTAPAHAAIDWDGSILTRVEYEKQDMDTPGVFNAFQEVTLAPQISNADVQILLGWKTDVNNLSDNTIDHGVLGDSLFQLQSATVSLRGAVVDGGPELMTTIGDFKLNDVDRKGVKIEGFDVGGLDSTGYLLFNAPGEVEYRADLAKTDGDVRGTGYVSHSDAGTIFVADALYDVSENLVVIGGIDSGADTYYAGGSMIVNDRTTVDGQYWSDDTYEVGATMDVPYEYDPVITVGYADRGQAGSGVNAGVAAVISDIDVAAAYDQIAAETQVKAGSGDLFLVENLYHNARPTGYVGKVTVGQERQIQVAARYGLDNYFDIKENTVLNAIVDMNGNIGDEGLNLDRNNLGVEYNTIMDIGPLQAVGIGGSALMNLVDQEPIYEVWAGYEMPNGIVIDAGYGNTPDVTGLNVAASKMIHF